MMPEDVQLVLHFQHGCVQVCPIQENGSQERGSQPVAEIGGKALSWGEEPFDRMQGTMGEGQPLAEVSVRGERGCKPVAEPSEVFLG